MKKSENGADDVVAKAAKLLAGAKKVYLATNGSHGHPNIRAMVPVTVEGVRTIWFGTFASSSKVLELQNDNHAVIYAEAPRMGGECRLWGYVEILDDKDSRKKVWNDAMATHFPDGIKSPDLRALRFDVASGTYSDKNWETFTFEIE